MKLDRWIALAFLLGSLLYGLAAFRYQLLPFEHNMAFLPNTLPKALSVIGVFISSIILLQPASDQAPQISFQTVKEFKLAQAIGLVIAMILYALLIRPIGFISATTLFIVGTSFILGERRFHILIPVALIAAGLIWYLVQQTLGIYLRPWPWFIHA